LFVVVVVVVVVVVRCGGGWWWEAAESFAVLSSPSFLCLLVLVFVGVVVASQRRWFGGCDDVACACSTLSSAEAEARLDWSVNGLLVVGGSATLLGSCWSLTRT